MSEYQDYQNFRLRFAERSGKYALGIPVGAAAGKNTLPVVASTAPAEFLEGLPANGDPPLSFQVWSRHSWPSRANEGLYFLGCYRGARNKVAGWPAVRTDSHKELAEFGLRLRRGGTATDKASISATVQAVNSGETSALALRVLRATAQYSICGCGEYISGVFVNTKVRQMSAASTDYVPVKNSITKALGINREGCSRIEEGSRGVSQ